MIICLLGRQPELSLAELDALFPQRVNKFGHEFALIDTPPATFDIQRLGGTLKAGTVQFELDDSDWQTISKQITTWFSATYKSSPTKITLGISAYGFRSVRKNHVSDLGNTLKDSLKRANVTVRLIPNQSPVLSTATSHHNKLGLSDNKVELVIVRANKKVILATSTGTQNITAYAKRDQARPARDAFVGMLPPKLAQIMLNLALEGKSNQQVLDPFCGTGVVLQEALLMGHTVYGSDLSDKMIDYTTRNLEWLTQTHRRYHLGEAKTIKQGDAMTTKWSYAGELSAVVCEGYLGQPFSATPSRGKLVEVRGNCNHIMGTFLKNIAPQLQSGTRLTVAVPAWRNLKSKEITRLPLISNLSNDKNYRHIVTKPLLYYREDQVVARDILVLEKR